MEVISFQDFMKGSTIQAFISPDPNIFEWVDVGFNATLVSAGVILTLVLLEKAGVSIDDTIIRWVMRASIPIAILWFIFKHSLIHHILVGW
ncbi:hypothetical protein GCM10008967_00490 [Bacillus carboniphilus]|uniref:Uncharacterized protein n=1 Tax=Bacillus carboniphilus TaxID=86663 RepID=A0ABN0VPB3_9BACI